MTEHQKYSFVKIPEGFYYEFFSEGPKGKIKKVVRYSLIDPISMVYNLGFGDWNEEINNIDDKAITNNEDRQKVLMTVADTIADFLRTHLFLYREVLVHVRDFIKWEYQLFGMRLVHCF